MTIRSALPLILVLAAAPRRRAARRRRRWPGRRLRRPTTADSTRARPPAPPEPVAEPVIVPPEPVRDDAIASASLDDLNRNSPLKPVFFDYDSSEISAAAQAVLNENAAVLKRYPTWTVTIEGHCDERGTAEYNLALGERRAVAARAYLVSLGIPADRLQNGQLRQGIPVRPGTRRSGVREEPARAFRHHREMRERHEPPHTSARSASCPSSCADRPSRFVDAGRRAEPGTAADDGRHADAAGADPAAPEPARIARRGDQGGQHARIDEQAEQHRKAFADQKLVIDNLSNNVREIREKLDDTNVRLGIADQEVDALRQGVQQLSARPAFTESAAPEPGAAPAAGTAPGAPGDAGTGVVTRPPQPRRAACRPDRHVAAETVRRGARPTTRWPVTISPSPASRRTSSTSREPSWPPTRRSTSATRTCRPARTTRRSKRTTRRSATIRTRPALPEAYYKKGIALKNLKQADEARAAFEYVVKTYPDSDARASLARQELRGT